jgi:hypothetical protein
MAMANIYNAKVVDLKPDYVKLILYPTSNTKNPQQGMILEMHGDTAHTHYTGVGQTVQIDLTLTPYINGVAQSPHTP